MGLIKNILLVFLILILGVGAYLLFRTDLFKTKLDGVQMIPSNAILVFESTDPVGVWNQMVNQPIWEKLNDLPALQDIEDQLISLDSLAGKSGKLYQALKGQKFTLSLHPIGKEEYGFLFTITSDNNRFLDFLQSLREDVANASHTRTRNYSGITIYESNDSENGREFSYAFHNNVWLGSYISFLVEDGIRYGKTAELKNFKESNPHLYVEAPSPTPAGILRMSGIGLSGFIRDLTLDGKGGLADGLAENLYTANLVPVFSDEAINFNGKLFIDGKNSSLTVLNGKGDGSAFSQMISNRAALINQYLINSPYDLKASPNYAFESRSTIMAEIEEEFEKEAFFKHLTGEMALVLEENLFSNTPNKTLLLKSTHTSEALGILKNFQLKTNQGDTSKIYNEYYLGKEIFMLDVEEFPAHLFEGNFNGFLRSYVTSVDDVVIIGNSLRNIKSLLDDIFNDNTWGKSLTHKENLNALKSDVPFQVLINNDRFFNILVKNSVPSWSSVFQKYASLFQSFHLITLSVAENDRFDLSFEINMEEKSTEGKLILTESKTIEFDEDLTYGPAGIQNFNDKSTDFLVQDEQFHAHLISEEGEVVFSYPLPGRIVSPIFQIDYYKNDKLQLVFATSDEIFGIDRYGNLLPDYPIPFEEGKKIGYLNLVDYDNNRNYRYFLSDIQGNLYIYDQFGELLDGWNPKSSSGGPLSTAPAHHRIPSQGDYMVALSKNGVLEMYSRKGQSKIGGGIQIGESISTSYAIEEEPTEGLSRIVTVNDAGEVVKANFKGELTYRSQLMRPDRDTQFKLINDQNLDEYLLVIEEFNRISVLQPDERVLFEMNIPTGDLEYQYFSFGSNNKIFAVVDKIQDFTYLYNSEGKLINQKPIDANPGIWINFSGSRNEYTLMSTHGDKLFEYKVPF
ncbi:MAG: hypothetical protein WD398_02145 [Cyclobacteriaceae bacterium]